MAKRTTVTLDDDVAAQLEEKARESGASFKEVINQALRVGLSRQGRPVRQRPFVVAPRPLGLRRGLSYDDIDALVEYGEGPHHR